MIEYVTLDYDGQAVIIEDGEIWDDERDDEVWNSEMCEWEEPELEDEPGEDLAELELRCYYWDRLDCTCR